MWQYYTLHTKALWRGSNGQTKKGSR